MNLIRGGDPLWPELPYEAWKDTYATLHRWTQVPGKISLALKPHVNHWWQAALHVHPRGLTTGPIPWRGEEFEMRFDFVDHELEIVTSWNERRSMALAPRSVASFYRETLELVRSLGIDARISPSPQEIPGAAPLDRDEANGAYDRDHAHRHFRILLQADRLMKRFRSGFIGKCSPVHFFWGSFDMTVTRFSGRTAPARPGADGVTREAYSHEVSSCGFWPGGKDILYPAFYAYAAPEPLGYSSATAHPKEAFYNPGTLGFILPYDVVRRARDPDALVLDFFGSTYEAAAEGGEWDREALEPSGPRRAA